MAQQPPQDYGAGEAQYGGQMGQGQGIGGQAQQIGGQAQQFGPPGGQGGMDIKLEEGLTDEMRVVLHDLVQSATACEWCAERCIDEGPQMAECLRLCRDVADLATLNIQLMARDSVFGPEAIQVFAEAAEACAQECARHGHRHCQECAEELSRAVQSVRKMLASFEQGGQMQPQTGGFQGAESPPQFGSFQGQQTGQPQSQQFDQPQAQPMVQHQGGSFEGAGGQGTGQHYSEGQPSPGMSGPQGPQY